MRSAKSWPHRWTYPVLGLLLAAAAPAGLVFFRSAISRASPTLDWLAGELAAQSTIYIYLTCGAVLVFVVFGAMLGHKVDQLESCSRTDALTGLASRVAMEERVTEELLRFVRYRIPAALLRIHLDDLGSINARGGYPAGDAALRTVADALRWTCRDTDLASRFSGDGFLVLASSTTAAEGLMFAQRLQTKLQSVKQDEPLTVTIGVADIESAYAGAW